MEYAYWNGEGRLQEDLNRLYGEIVPPSGPAATREGEILRAATRLHYEFFNNGGGNDVSGCVRFLRNRLPGFKEEWRDLLEPFAAGEDLPQEEEYDAVRECCEKVVDAAVQHVVDQEGRYSDNVDDMFDMGSARPRR